MTEPSQYFKGRTVQEQMNEVIGYVDVRSAEVATNAIAADVARVHQDMLDADADATAAAASAAAAAGTLANAVKKTGEASQSIAGDITVSGTLRGGVVTGTQVTVPTPVNNTDAATKKYVDDLDANDVKLTGPNAISTLAVLLTDNQRISGIKAIMGNQLFMRSSTLTEGDTLSPYGVYPVLSFIDKDHPDAGAFDNNHCSARVASIQNGTNKTIEITNFFTFGGERKSFVLEMIANQSTGAQFIRVKWSDGTYTTIASKVL